MVDVPLNGTVVEHMEKLGVDQSALSKHFYYNSKLFRAIQKAIGERKRIVNHPKGYIVVRDRAHGPSVSLTEAYCRDKFFKDENFTMELRVTYFHESENEEEYPSTKDFKYHLAVPKDLEMNFTQEKFDVWLAAKEEENKKEDRKNAKELLTKLQTEFPELFH